MSRGIGSLQREVLKSLESQMQDSIAIACAVTGRNPCTESDVVNVRRALRSLADRELVVDMGRAWHDGRRRWATPEVAAGYRDRVTRTFGA